MAILNNRLFKSAAIICLIVFIVCGFVGAKYVFRPTVHYSESGDSAYRRIEAAINSWDPTGITTYREITSPRCFKAYKDFFNGHGAYCTIEYKIYHRDANSVLHDSDSFAPKCNGHGGYSYGEPTEAYKAIQAKYGGDSYLRSIASFNKKYKLDTKLIIYDPSIPACDTTQYDKIDPPQEVIDTGTYGYGLEGDINYWYCEPNLIADCPKPPTDVQ